MLKVTVRNNHLVFGEGLFLNFQRTPTRESKMGSGKAR